MNQNINVNDWVAMFREIGLAPAQMEQWHRLFEARHPAGHQSFLEWLGLSPAQVERVRAASRG